MSGHEVTERDRDVLMYVCRHGACTPEQVARAAPSGRPFFTSQWACYRRIRALVSLGLLTQKRTWWSGRPNVVMTSQLGTRFVDIDLPPARFSAPTLEHTVALVDLSEHVLASHRQAIWLTERELRRDAMRAQRAEGLGARSATPPRSPDGMLLPPDERHIAIELDLTPKRSEAYSRILNAYAGMNNVSGVWWFSPKKTILTRVAALAREDNMDSFVATYFWTPPVLGAHGQALGD